jgi:hypothetical protein
MEEFRKKRSNSLIPRIKDWRKRTRCTRQLSSSHRVRVQATRSKSTWLLQETPHEKRSRQSEISSMQRNFKSAERRKLSVSLARSLARRATRSLHITQNRNTGKMEKTTTKHCTNIFTAERLHQFTIYYLPPDSSLTYQDTPQYFKIFKFVAQSGDHP